MPSHRDTTPSVTSKRRRKKKKNGDGNGNGKAKNSQRSNTVAKHNPTAHHK